MSEYYRNITEYHLWAIPDNSIPKLFSFAWKTMKKKQLLKTQRSVFTDRDRERESGGLLAGPWVFGDFLAKGILAVDDASMKLAGSIRSSIRVDLIALEEKSKVMEDTEGPWRPMCLESILNDTNTACNVSVSQVRTNYVAERSSKFTFAASSGGTSQSSQRWGFQTFQRCSQNFNWISQITVP